MLCLSLVQCLRSETEKLQKETNKLKLEDCETKQEKINAFINLDTIIEMELNRKYNNFEDSKESIRRKMGL